MDEFLEAFGQRTWLPFSTIAGRLLLAAILGALVGFEREWRNRPAGPIRLVEATTAGVAFLAAGLIFFAKGEVHGLTTGAGMWLAGAIGLAVGLGFGQIASFATLLATIVLGLLQYKSKT